MCWHSAANLYVIFTDFVSCVSSEGRFQLRPAYTLLLSMHLSQVGCRKSVYKYFSRAGKVFLNTSHADFSGAEEVSDKHYIEILFRPGEVFKYMHFSDAGEAWEVKTSFRRRRSIYAHIFRAGEVLIYTYFAPVRPGKPEKYLYTPLARLNGRHACMATWCIDCAMFRSQKQDSLYYMEVNGDLSAIFQR